VDEVSLKLNEQKAAMQWLVRTVQSMSPVPVSVDSSNIEIIQAGLEACQTKAGSNLLNSASLERLEALDLAREHDTRVIVTAAGGKGMPQNEGERIENASRMVEAALARGIPLASIYVDVLVFPISVDGQFGHHALETIRQLRARYGSEIHITGGLSNVSFGLPCRRLINDVFILLSLEAGADSGIIDPVASNLKAILAMDRQARPHRMTEDVLLGRDRHCKNFLRAYRKGELQYPSRQDRDGGDGAHWDHASVPDFVLERHPGPNQGLRGPPCRFQAVARPFPGRDRPGGHGRGLGGHG
jgi:5-methyltetrahydrofolate--homocysteine methyltransferase